MFTMTLGHRALPVAKQRGANSAQTQASTTTQHAVFPFVRFEKWEARLPLISIIDKKRRDINTERKDRLKEETQYSLTR